MRQLEEDNKETFATALSCMDGRTKGPVRKWAKETFGVDYVDMITEPGMDNVINNILPYSKFLWFKLRLVLHILRHFFSPDMTISPEFMMKLIDLNFIKFKVMISVEKHKSKGLVVSGHNKCAGHPTTEEGHRKDIRAFCERLKYFLGVEIPIYGLYVDVNESGEWMPEVVYKYIPETTAQEEGFLEMPTEEAAA